MHEGKVKSVTYAYMDDVIIASDDIEAHLEHTPVVFDAFLKARLTVNPQKCDFLRSSTTFLGHFIDPTGIRPDPKKVEVIRNWPVLSSQKEVQKFIGLVNYYRTFIEGFTLLTAPLRELNVDGVEFAWKEHHQKAFQALKLAVTTAPCLAHPDYDKAFIIYTDACRNGIGLPSIRSNRTGQNAPSHSGEGDLETRAQLSHPRTGMFGAYSTNLPKGMGPPVTLRHSRVHIGKTLDHGGLPV